MFRERKMRMPDGREVEAMVVNFNANHENFNGHLTTSAVARIGQSSRSRCSMRARASAFWSR
jgi:hypothetical protein